LTRYPRPLTPNPLQVWITGEGEGAVTRCTIAGTTDDRGSHGSGVSAPKPRKALKGVSQPRSWSRCPVFVNFWRELSMFPAVDERCREEQVMDLTLRLWAADLVLRVRGGVGAGLRAPTPPVRTTTLQKCVSYERGTPVPHTLPGFGCAPAPPVWAADHPTHKYSFH